MHKNTLQVKHISAAYSSKQEVLQDVSFQLEDGSLTGVVGPNGAGKSTLLKILVGLLKPLKGEVLFNSYPLCTLKHAIAYVPQRFSVDWDFPINVFDVVMMGRFRYLPLFRSPCQQDKNKVWEALECMELSDLATCSIRELSGGQQQRVFIARALVQEMSLFLLDEPFNNVDMASEKIIINMLQSMRDQGKIIMVVHHDFQTIHEYFDTILLLNKKTVAFGATQQVMQREYICTAYKNRNICIPR